MFENRILYLGLSLPANLKELGYVHYPIIKIVPRPFDSPDIQSAFSMLQKATHLIFTSKTSVSLFIEACKKFSILFPSRKAKVIAIGEATANALKKEQISVDFLPKEATAEGIINLLSKMKLHHPHFFWPHSTLSRPNLRNYFQKNSLSFTELLLYKTVPHIHLPLPDLQNFSEIFFTSPSTVDAFLAIFGAFPKQKKLTSIGPITKNYLKGKLGGDKTC